MTKTTLVTVALASLAIGIFAGAQLFEQPAPDRTIQAATRLAAPAAPPVVTPTTAPAPPAVITQRVEVPVVLQACKDAINQTTGALGAVAAQWNDWVAAHSGGATAEDYQAIAQATISSGQEAAAQVAPAAAACLDG